MAENNAQFGLWTESAQKFDYFIAGLIGAVIAYIAQSFAPERLGWNPTTLELVALLTLTASFWCAFKRIEIFADYLRVKLQRDEFEESVRQLRHAADQGTARDLQTGLPLTDEDRTARINANLEMSNNADETLKSKSKKAPLYYKARNYLLVVGFVLLLAARIAAAYTCHLH